MSQGQVRVTILLGILFVIELALHGGVAGWFGQRLNDINSVLQNAGK